MMDALSDNVLVMVLQLVDMQDLLTCRLVSKRLGALAVLPGVWEHRVLVPGDRLVCPVLRLAPCLATMYVLLPQVKRCHMAYAATRCAVRELKLIVGPVTGCVHAAAVVCRQEALGRLECVDVIFGTDENVSELLATIASTPGLQRVELATHPLLEFILRATTDAVLHSTAVTPSLKRFDCVLVPDSEPYVNFILARHAATLESVELGPCPLSMTLTATAPLLATMPNLRELGCCCLPGLEEAVVAASTSLRVLNLYIRTEREHLPDSARAKKLLTLAKHLREVSLEYTPAITRPSDVGANLVLALAASGAPVEKLSITNDHVDDGEEMMLEEHFPQMALLLCVLPRLRTLRHLQVGAGGEYVLMGITPTTAPALRQVDVHLSEGVCAHAWLHEDMVRTVMSENSALHLKVVKPSTVYCGHESCEEACVLDCHKILCDRTQPEGETHLGFFSHDSADRCSLHATDSLWIQIP